MNGKIIIFLIFIIIALGIGGWLIYSNYSNANNTGNATSTPIAQANYLCDDQKTIAASFFQGEEIAVAEGEMPQPSGSVELVLSDGRNLTLPQTISASGIRYANTDESIIFWSKGNGAFITENDSQTYTGCIVLSSNPGDLPGEFASSTLGFSIRYPEGYSVNTSYKYQALGPGKDNLGVKFVIPESMTTGTNLSSFDTGVSIEQMPNIEQCQADLFVGYAESTSTEIINNVTYSVALSNDAGAGNFYEETVWAIPGTSPCLAIRYFVHSSNIGNYPPDTVVEFDKQALLEQFDEIRDSLVIE